MLPDLEAHADAEQRLQSTLGDSPGLVVRRAQVREGRPVRWADDHPGRTPCAFARRRQASSSLKSQAQNLALASLGREPCKLATQQYLQGTQAVDAELSEHQDRAEGGCCSNIAVCDTFRRSVACRECTCAAAQARKRTGRRLITRCNAADQRSFTVMRRHDAVSCVHCECTPHSSLPRGVCWPSRAVHAPCRASAAARHVPFRCHAARMRSCPHGCAIAALSARLFICRLIVEILPVGTEVTWSG